MRAHIAALSQMYDIWIDGVPPCTDVETVLVLVEVDAVVLRLVVAAVWLSAVLSMDDVRVAEISVEDASVMRALVDVVVGVMPGRERETPTLLHKFWAKAIVSV